MKAIRRNRRLLNSSVFAGLVITIGFSIRAPRVVAQDGRAAHPSPRVSQSSSGANSPNIVVEGNVTINPPADKTPPTVYLGCDTVPLPIRVAPASTIHFLRLSPSIISNLVRAEHVPGGGGLDSIDSPPDQPLEWPSVGHDGRWITTPEFEKRDWFASFLAAKCEVTSYGAETLEDTVITIVVWTSDNKDHYYPLKFDPLVQNRPFTFYIVNLCSTGVYAIDFTWVPNLTTRVMGRRDKEIIPLKFESKGFLSSLSSLGGAPSAFLWNAVPECKDW
jgi:hypothetical protein